MARQVITADDVVSYPTLSQAIKVGNTIYCSGQVARNKVGEVVAPDDAGGQAEQAFQNLAAVLRAAGAGLEDVVKVTIYVKNLLENKAKVAEVRKRHFESPPPATTLVGVVSLADPNMLVEVDAIAVVD